MNLTKFNVIIDASSALKFEEHVKNVVVHLSIEHTGKGMNFWSSSYLFSPSTIKQTWIRPKVVWNLNCTSRSADCQADYQEGTKGPHSWNLQPTSHYLVHIPPHFDYFLSPEGKTAVERLTSVVMQWWDTCYISVSALGSSKQIQKPVFIFWQSTDPRTIQWPVICFCCCLEEFLWFHLVLLGSKATKYTSVSSSCFTILFIDRVVITRLFSITR